MQSLKKRKENDSDENNKGAFTKLIANIRLDDERLNAFSLQLRTRQNISNLRLLVNIILKVLVGTRQKKQTKDEKNWKGGSKTVSIYGQYDCLQSK